MANQDRPFTIAISGCSSAGKSTLAFLLAEIFADPSTTSSEVQIIHGDAFFMPKHLCPLITYTSAPTDTTFCQATLTNDHIGEYAISWDGTRANNAFMTYTPSTTKNVSSYAGSITSESPEYEQNNHPEVHDRVPSNDSVATTFSIASRLHEGGRTKVFTISGPDTDCDEAVNFVRMFDALKHTSKHNEIDDVTKCLGTMNIEHETKSDTDSEAGGALLASPISEHSEEGGVPLFSRKQEVEDLAPPFPHLTIDIPALQAHHAELISSLRIKIQESLVQTSKEINHPCTLQLPRMQIIESFRLFSDPSTITPGDSQSDTMHLLEIMHTFLHKLQVVSLKLAEAGDVDDELEQERAAIEHDIQIINTVCKRGMSDFFSTKLWLSTSEVAAKSRRFDRPAYIDTKDGGLREPGQMWKTEGYFDQIAWKNHVDAHAWLIGEDGGEETGELGTVKEGIHVRAQDLGVEDTVRWAVGAVLEEMTKNLRIGEKIEEKVSCGSCEGCDAKGGEW
ncbi:hypothetical protein N431DRAFT_468983 [Stipitochalara longipes BDJ]|nr:hypothetical protein N431DRAFT_468983 [Stipitochalara longipes BDJ]